MKIFKYISIVFLLIGFSFALVQCAKEDVTKKLEEDIKLDFRYDGSSCNPQDLYSDYTNCTFKKDTDTITISNIFSSNNNYLFNICPGVEIPVIYFITKCFDDYGHQVTLISGLEYDMDALLQACPNLRSIVRTAYYTGGDYVGILDLIDDEISQQIEEGIARERVLEDHIDCDEDYYSIKYIKNTCYRWELVPIISRYKEYRWAKVDCGSSVCCVRFNKYCASFYDDGSIRNFVKVNDTDYETFEGECEDGCSHDCGK